MDVSKVGQRIKEIRMKRGLTQDELAEKANISTTHVSVIERAVKIPQLDTFAAICTALNVSADEILYEIIPVPTKVEVSELALMLDNQPADIKRRIIRAVKAAVEE